VITRQYISEVRLRREDISYFDRYPFALPAVYHLDVAGTREICRQLPTIQHTVAVFEANGFALMEHRRIDQATAASLREFAERIRFRADTALALISDSEFQEGQAAIETVAAQEHVASSVVERIELLVFENDRCENVV
jgi:hypothetical protein